MNDKKPPHPLLKDFEKSFEKQMKKEHKEPKTHDVKKGEYIDDIDPADADKHLE